MSALSVNRTIKFFKNRNTQIGGLVFLCVSAVYACFGKISKLTKMLFENIYACVFPSFLQSILSEGKLLNPVSLMNNKMSMIAVICGVYASYDISKMIYSKVCAISKKISTLIRSKKSKEASREKSSLVDCENAIKKCEEKETMLSKARSVVGRFLMLSVVKMYAGYDLSNEFRDVDEYMASSYEDAVDRVNMSNIRVLQYIGSSIGISVLLSSLPSIKDSLKDNVSLKDMCTPRCLANMMATYCFSSTISSVGDGLAMSLSKHLKYKEIIYGVSPMSISSAIKNVMTMVFNQSVEELLSYEVQGVVMDSASLIRNEMRLFRMKEL